MESWPDSNVKSSVRRSGILRQRIIEVAPALEIVSAHLMFVMSERRVCWWLLWDGRLDLHYSQAHANTHTDFLFQVHL